MKTSHFSPDVIVIGSGAGGGAASWRLVKSGLKVLLIEAGPRFNPTKDYKQDQSNWESGFPHKKNSVGNYEVAPMQLLDSSFDDIRSWNKLTGNLITSKRRASFGYHHVRGVGGSSLQFTGEAHRLNPNSMKMRSAFDVSADWPVSYEELDPYYSLAEEIVGVSGPKQDLSRPRSSELSQKAHPLSYASQLLANAAEEIGHSPIANSLAILSSPYASRPSCNYCGGCQRGCQRKDKGSIDVTYIKEIEQNSNFRILSDSEVINIRATKDNTTSILFARAGNLHEVTAQHFILAAGAIQTPRLLMNSSSEFHKSGIGNSEGNVGKYFMETILNTSSALHPSPLGSHRGLPVDWISWKYNSPGTIPNFRGGCRFSPSMAESDLVGPISYATRVIGGWGLKHKIKMRQHFGSVLSMTGISESLPNNKSYISLSSKKDKWGQPIPVIHSYITNEQKAAIRFMRTECRLILSQAGCYSPFEEFSSADAFSSTHVFGTCRMGNNPKSSVVDPWGKLHDMNNLWIADASVFPSSGGGESPGLTIQALAIRTADKLLEVINKKTLKSSFN